MDEHLNQYCYFIDYNQKIEKNETYSIIVNNKIQLEQMKMTPLIAMIFDVETTGLLNMRAALPALELCPNVLQLSYIMYDIRNKETIKQTNHYVKIPDDVIIAPQSYAVHGITREMCNVGKPMVDILEEFYRDYHNSHLLIAHNYKFDSTMINIEIQRNWPLLKEKCPYSLNLFTPVYMKNNQLQKCCTMETCTDLCKITFPDRPEEPGKPVRYKWPTLLELHRHLFKTEPENLHNSLVDCMVCLRCFLKVYNDYHMDEEVFKAMVLSALGC